MNKFNKKLKDTTAIERDKLVLDIELEDQTAPADWFFNGEPIKSSDRFVVFLGSFNISEKKCTDFEEKEK